MSRYLITQSLLSAFNYLLAADEDNDAALTDFLRVLRREPAEPNEFMQNGIDFEAECYAAADGAEVERAGAREIGGIIRNAARQVKLSREVTIDGTDFLVYGILDGLKAGVIYDIKFSNKPLGSVAELGGRYFHSPQHPAYFFLVPEAYQFTYLVSDGVDIYAETYRPAESTRIEALISEFMAFLTTAGYLDTYKEKWECKAN